MAIFKWLEDSPLVQAVAVLLAEQDATRRHLKLRVVLRDDSILFVNEFINPDARKYFFHWQAADGQLIARWDNAPHYPGISTLPHHRHRGTTVEACLEVTLEDVWREIENWA